jgi:hypothetical protein
MESEITEKTEFRLAPHAGSTFSACGDLWFNVYIYSADAELVYGIDAGTRHYLAWNSDGKLDLFEMAPQ